MSPCRSKPILIVCDKEMVLESVEHVPVVAKEKEVVPFDDWGGSGGEFNGGVVDVICAFVGTGIDSGYW